MSLDEYQSQVLRNYLKRKNNSEFLNNLLNPTPGNLKAECSIAFDRRYDKNDEHTIASFFQPREDEEAYRRAIANCKAEKFRRLSDVMKKGEGNTDRTNIELLAWLIDFKPRPYQLWLKLERKDLEKEDENKDTKKKIDDHRPVKRRETPNRREAVVVMIILAVGLTCGIIYFFWSGKAVVPGVQLRTVVKTGKCMYWNGGEYKAVPCGQLHGDTPVVAFDTIKLVRLKSLPKESITESSIRKAGYIKILGSIEFFTDTGTYPLDPNRRLLPLSDYMYKKYVAGRH